MADKPRIRAMERDQKEYQRLVANARAKVRRLERNLGYTPDFAKQLPEKYSRVSKDTINAFGERDEFNKWKSQMQSFTDRSNKDQQFVGNKYDVVVSKSELEKITQDNIKARELAQLEIEKQRNKPYISGGKEHGTVGEYASHMGEDNILEIYVPPEFDFESVRNKQRLEDIGKSMDRRSKPEHFDERQDAMRDTFIATLSASFHSDADELVEKLKDLTGAEFYDMYVRFSEFDFALFYPPDAIDEVHEAQLLDEQNSDIAQMISYVDNYKSGQYNTDLAGF